MFAFFFKSEDKIVYKGDRRLVPSSRTQLTLTGHPISLIGCQISVNNNPKTKTEPKFSK